MYEIATGNDPHIILSSNDRFNIQKKTNINHIDIYQVDFGDCLRYISPENGIEYIGIIYEDSLYIFNLKNNNQFSEDLLSNINANFNYKFDDFLKILKEEAQETQETQETQDFWYEVLANFRKMRKKFTLYRNLHLSECPNLIDLSEAKHTIEQLNIELNTSCPGFNINLDYNLNLIEPKFVSSFFNPQPTDLVLCLFRENFCVSSISIKFIGNEISIDTRTDTNYEGRKFNKLLISILIYIAKQLDITKEFIYSEAVNPISAYVMLRNFNATSEAGFNNTSTMEELAREIDENLHIITNVELTDANIEKAKLVFNETITKIDCGPFKKAKKGGKRKSKRNKSKRNKSKRKTKQRNNKSKRKTK